MKISMAYYLAIVLFVFGTTYTTGNEPKHKLLHERSAEDYQRLLYGDASKFYEEMYNSKYISYNNMHKLLLEFGVPESKLNVDNIPDRDWKKKTLMARDIEKIDHLKVLEHESPMMVIVQVPGKDDALEKYRIEWGVFQSSTDLIVHGIPEYIGATEFYTGYLLAGPIDGPGDVCFVPRWCESDYPMTFNRMLFWRGTTLVHIQNLDVTNNEDAIFKLGEELDKILIERQKNEAKNE